MAGNRPRRLINFCDWKIRLSRKSRIVENFRNFISQSGWRFCREIFRICWGSYCPYGVFGRPLQVTVRPILRDRCHLCPILFVCNVGVLWPNVGWIKMPLNWYEGRPRFWPLCARWGPSSSTERGTAAPTFAVYGPWPMSIVAKGLDELPGYHLVRR